MIVEGDEKMDDIILVQPVRIIRQDSSDYGEWEREILAYRQEFLENGGFIIMKLLRDGWNRSEIVLLIIILILEFRSLRFLR